VIEDPVRIDENLSANRRASCHAAKKTTAQTTAASLSILFSG